MFERLDKIKPVYDIVYKVLLVICKLFLIADILITTLSVLGRYVSFIPDPSWSEEVVLTLMSYMAVLSAALAIRRGAHIRMTAFDRYLPEKVLKVLDLVADLMVLAFAIVMMVIGTDYASTIGSKGSYVSMPSISRIWMYLPIPVAGVSMIVFELEAIYSHIKSLVLKTPYLMGAVEDENDEVAEALKKAAAEEAEAEKEKAGKESDQ
ncbi:MAG: TRAP transporter small permease [Lachnospiraceae bacterium]|nr:TRAP transporter small permease [Lachnospiraceae bacterium]